MTLGILLPTRGRPANLARFIDACRETGNNWLLYVRLDTDDPALEEYNQIFAKPSLDVSVYRGDRIGFGASLNELAAYAEREDVSHLGMFGDDVLPITRGWDTTLMDALGGRLGVSYGDDGLRDKHAPDLPTHYVTQTEVYRRLGYLAPPTIRHLFLDNVARDIGRYLGNFVYKPVKIQHLHPWVEGEQLHDTTYAEGGRNPELRRADQMAYIRWSQDRDWKRSLKK